MRNLVKGIIITIVLILVVRVIFVNSRFYFYNPIFQPFSSRLNEDKLLLQVGDTFKLRPQALNKRVSYKSSNIRVADVLPFGKVWAKAVGTCIITVEGNHGKDHCKVTVIDINHHKVTLKIGETATLSIKGTGKKVKWKSSNSKATVTKKGVVTACESGRAVITATVGGKQLECNVYIKK